MQTEKSSTAPPESYIIEYYVKPPIIDHEPPIGVDGGEGAIDIPKDNTLDDPVSPLAGPQVYTYKSKKNPPTVYRCISDLFVITEDEDGYVTLIRYKLPEFEGAKLQLWYSSGGAPDIVFEGTGTNGKLTVKDSLNPPTPTSKPKRPYRRVCSASNSRIIRWALVNSAGAVIKDPVIGRELKDSGDDSYYFYISFHPHPLP